MTTGEIVRTARETRGYTMQELADRSGTSLQTIFKIETNRVTPRMDTMLALIEAMDYEIVFKPKYKGGYYGE
jgi:transcriptional regulator with XRE-family HTH domain